MIVWIVTFLVLFGAFFGLIAAIGVARMPDVYCRMHAATKAGAFGVILLAIALALAVPGTRVLIQGALIVVFFYLTSPIAAQMLGRAATLQDIKPWRAPDPPDREPAIKPAED